MQGRLISCLVQFQACLVSQELLSWFWLSFNHVWFLKNRKLESSFVHVFGSLPGNKSYWNKLLVTHDEYFSSRAFGEQEEEVSNSVGGDSLGGALAEYNMQVCKDLINT